MSDNDLQDYRRVIDERVTARMEGYRAGIADAARACAARAARHGDSAERLLPSTAAIEFMALRGESIACEREVLAMAGMG